MSPVTDELRRLALGVQLAAFPGPVLDTAAARLLDDGLAGVCLFGSNTVGGLDAVAKLSDAVHRAGRSAIVAVDEEGGDVTRLYAATGSPWPGPAVLGVVDDPDRTAATARAIGAELRRVGIDLDLAPVADVNTSPDNPIIGVRSFGSDPSVVARHVAAWVAGLQSAGVAACAKHFPGHGDTVQDSHTELPSVDVPLDVLRRRELVPFAAAVEAGAATVMTSHIVLAALDPHRPATLSATVPALLRDQLGFCGAIVTDALDMAGASAGRGIPAAAVLALVAGADLLTLGPDKDVALVEAVAGAVVDAVRSGVLPEERLRDAAVRVGEIRRSGASTVGDAAAVDAAAVDAAVLDARRAIRVEGELPPLAGALVVRVETPPTIAVGAVPWGIEPDLAVDPGDASAVDVVLRTGGARPVLLQVRDLHRQPAAAELVERIAGKLPDLVLVEWGWPAPTEIAVSRICTHGASAASRRALEQLLEETTGWGR